MKIAILGTENTHAFEFAKLINKDESFSDMELIGAYGYDEKANEKLKNAGFCSYFAKSPDEFTDSADAVIITARHGDHHYEYGMPYLKKGINAFIDKPFAIKEENAREMIDTARKKGALICGGSSLKHLDELSAMKNFIDIRRSENKLSGGFIYAPINMVNEYGGFHFYAAHLIEMLLGTFGKGIRSVKADCPDENKNRIHIIFSYDDLDIIGEYYDAYHYGMTVLTKSGPLSFHTSDISYLNKKELAEFHSMLQKGKMDMDYEDFMYPVKLQNAIMKSYSSGGERVIL